MIDDFLEMGGSVVGLRPYGFVWRLNCWKGLNNDCVGVVF